MRYNTTAVKCGNMSINKQYNYDSMSQVEKQSLISQIAQDTLEVSNHYYPECKLRDTFYTRHGKRMLDIIISGIALIVSFPINLIIGIVTYFDVGKPIFFVQKRIGKGGKLFNLLKFRNMHNTTDERGVLLRADYRVTKWGRFVRKTSLDELLNFVSIFTGDMSLIGPRPLPVGYKGRFNRYHEQRHAVRPGLDCPLRDPSKSMTWENRLENDIWYVQNVSLTTDIKLIFLLVRETLFGKDRAARSSGFSEGSFIGYFEDGRVMDSMNIPEKYYIKALYDVADEESISDEATLKTGGRNNDEDFKDGDANSAFLDKKAV